MARHEGSRTSGGGGGEGGGESNSSQPLPPSAPVKEQNAEVDEEGREYLAQEKWQKMSNSVQTPSHQQPQDSAEGILDLVFTKLYGDLPKTERFRVLWLAGTLFFIIGGYWLLRSLKDPIVATIVGVEYIPKCKMASLVVVFALVFVYNHLIDLMPKHQLFYVVGGFYVCVFGSVAYLLNDPEIGIYNTKSSPDRYLGWVSYCAIESFGSICVSLFWAFTNNTMSFEGAKSAYGLIIAGANMGSILGPTIAASQATKIGVPKLYSVGSFCMAMMVLMVFAYVRIFGVPPDKDRDTQHKEGQPKKEKPGVMEGFTLFMKYHYVKGIFAISCLFMVEVTILDYMMKVLATATFRAQFPDDPVAATKHFAAFMGTFGQVTNTISFMFSLLGTSIVIRTVGLRKTIVLFPTICLCVVATVIMMPRLTTVFVGMIVLKGFSYSLNNPCKEMLYQPTSTAIKFKSKSWIDIFGARGSKATASLVTNQFSDSVSSLITYGGFVAMGVSAFLIWVATYMGRTFDEYIETGHVVGESDEESNESLEDLAAGLEGDTSCGLEEEGQQAGGGGGGEGGRDGQSPGGSGASKTRDREIADRAHI